jgi:hypothetical protein
MADEAFTHLRYLLSLTTSQHPFMSLHTSHFTLHNTSHFTASLHVNPQHPFMSLARMPLTLAAPSITCAYNQISAFTFQCLYPIIIPVRRQLAPAAPFITRYCNQLSTFIFQYLYPIIKPVRTYHFSCSCQVLAPNIRPYFVCVLISTNHLTCADAACSCCSCR